MDVSEKQIAENSKRFDRNSKKLSARCSRIRKSERRDNPELKNTIISSESLLKV
jgi:hypothetical protein